MDESLSEAIREAYATSPIDAVLLHTLEIRNPNFTTPIRIVMAQPDRYLTLEPGADIDPGESVLFTAFAFDFDMPQLTDGKPPSMGITIDNVSRDVLYYIDLASQNPESTQVVYRLFLDSDHSTPQNIPPIIMDVGTVTVDAFSIRFQATFGDLANRTFPGLTYTSFAFPGLVAN